jgi:hypothetical protein
MVKKRADKISFDNGITAPEKFIFQICHQPKSVEKRVSKEGKIHKLKIEFFKDQCSSGEYGEVFTPVNSVLKKQVLTIRF